MMENTTTVVEDILYFTGMIDNDTMTSLAPPPPRTPDSCSEGLMVQRFIMEVIVCLPIALIGILGNLLSFVVLCRQKQRLTTTVLLQGLAVMDTLILVTSVLLRSLRYMHICVGGLDLYYANYHYIFRWMYPCVYFFRQAQTWLITLLTIDRWIAVCRPLHAQRLCTLSVAYKQMAGVLITAFIVSVPRFFEYQIVDLDVSSFGFQLTEFSKNKVYTIAYRIVIFFIIMYLVPMVTLTVLNTQLLFTLRKANIYRASMQSRMSSSRSQSSMAAAANRNHRSVTVIVCIVVLLCIVCNLFAIASHLLWSLAECFTHLHYLEEYRRYIVRGSNILVTVSSAVNFFIYCVCSRNFRSVLMRTFLCRRRCALRGLKSASRSSHHNMLTNHSHTSLTYFPVNRGGGGTGNGCAGSQKLLKHNYNNTRL